MWSSKPALGLVVVAWCCPAAAAEDLGALEVVGQRGQSLEQTRRDRYECHNWAVEQTGESPRAAVPVDAAAPDAKQDLRNQRINRALIGAAIGGALGGIFGDGYGHHGHGDDSGEDVLVGAAAGAAIGAATAGSRRKEPAAAQPEEPSEYLRALTACLEGRGYSVSLPTAAELTASR